MMKKVYTFLKELKKNNNREWFNTHKDRYLEVKQYVDGLTQDVINAFGAEDPRIASLTPADCTYRIYRDTRFSPDKTPYKTHIGIFICPGGKKSTRCGYYIHLEPGNSFIGGGCWCPPAPILKAIRKEIYDNVDEYLEIIENPEFKARYTEVGFDRLKTAPKGFPKDWEYIDLLKPRDYTVLAPVGDDFMKSPDVVSKIVSYFKTQVPFNQFIDYVFDETGEDDRV
ncbi:MAG: DUF2461 domain-containing protein [Muribaculaceae bacterium]|nr:DUF2461 domain-containing protein [Muribaculaceae bacterium]